MRLSCPNCQTEYEVPDGALTGRSRKLRCAQCMTVWQAEAISMYGQEPIPEPAAETSATPLEIPQPEVPADIAMPEAPVEPASERLTAQILDRSAPIGVNREQQDEAEPEPSPKLGLLVSALIVVVLVAVVLMAHRSIGHIWPPSLRLFNALGLR